MAQWLLTPPVAFAVLLAETGLKALPWPRAGGALRCVTIPP